MRWFHYIFFLVFMAAIIFGMNAVWYFRWKECKAHGFSDFYCDFQK